MDVLVVLYAMLLRTYTGCRRILSGIFRLMRVVGVKKQLSV